MSNISEKSLECGRRFVPVITARRAAGPLSVSNDFCVVEQKYQFTRVRRPINLETVVVEEIVARDDIVEPPKYIKQTSPDSYQILVSSSNIGRQTAACSHHLNAQRSSSKLQHVKIIRMSSSSSFNPPNIQSEMSTISNSNNEKQNFSLINRQQNDAAASMSNDIFDDESVDQSESICKVCGDGHAKLHYGVLACYGCKGFFRRTITGKYRYVCRFGNNCIVDKYQRNSCRYCRFSRCLAVGMDPKAVRPDRDLTGKQKAPRSRKRMIDVSLIDHMMRIQSEGWSRKIPVECRMLLLQLMNIESKVAKGDQSNGLCGPPSPKLPSEKLANVIYRKSQNESNLPDNRLNPSSSVTLKDLFEQKPNLEEKRTEMGYEPYRMTRPEELSKIAHRGAIAAVDWVESLAQLATESTDSVLDTEDKIALVRACYAPLTIFNFSARTTQNTKNPDILCLCSHSYVTRKLPPNFNGSNHLSNNLIDRTLNELVAPLRALELHEEEVIPLKSIIILNPNAKNLSAEAQKYILELRDRVQDMLFQVVKELYPSSNPASRFGNLLLLLPSITTLSGVMQENMQFSQVFGWSDPLLNELFESDLKFEDPLVSLAPHSNTTFDANSFSFSPSDEGLQTTQPSPPSSYSFQSPSVVGCDRCDDSTQTDCTNIDVYNFQPMFSTFSENGSTTPYDSSFESLLTEPERHNRMSDSDEIADFSNHDFGDLNQMLSPSFVGNLLDEGIHTLIAESEADSSSSTDLFNFLR